MKRFLLMIVLALMAAGLISCGKQNEAVDPLPQNEEVEVEKDPGSQTEAQIEEPKEAPSRIELVTGRYDEAQGMPYEYATITAYRSTGDVVWRYETPKFTMTELPAVVELGQKDSCYYFVENTSVVCLDVQSGAVLWKNSDYAGRKTGAAFGDAAIYLCGQYGPDFYAVSYTGETLARIEQFDPGYYWASEIELQDGYAAVYLHGGTSNYDDPKIFYVDLRTYAVRSELDERAAEPLPLDQLKLLLDAYFADYPWGNEDIVSGSAVNGCWKNDTEALFEIRVQTKSAEWTHQANILVGTVSIDAERLTGYIEWTGGNKEDIDLQTGQSAANDNSYMEQYKAVLLVHPTMSSGYTTEYTLYDIDKNGIPELIVREKAVWYYIYTFDGTKVVSSEENYWSYSNCLYAYDGNGIAVHDGGMGYLHVEYVSLFSMTDNRLEWADTLMSTEECSYEDLRAFLDTLTPIDDFIPITDDSYLAN